MGALTFYMDFRCGLDDERGDGRTRLVMSCNDPLDTSKLTYHSFGFQQFQSGEHGYTFEVNHTYYFIATSNGNYTLFVSNFIFIRLSRRFPKIIVVTWLALMNHFWIEPRLNSNQILTVRCNQP